MKIKIKSNPYEKNIEYYSYDFNEDKWDNIIESNPNSKLREERTDTMFFPFRIDEIINIIFDEYYTGDERIDLIFEGTSDEYNALALYFKSNDFSDKINLVMGEQYIDDAKDVLKEIKNIFKDTYPVVKRIIDDSDVTVNKNLKKVSDALDDIVPICVFGNYSAGKSTFINSLIGNEILPSGVDPVTAKVYKISIEKDDQIVITFDYCNICNGEEKLDKYKIYIKNNDVIYKKYNENITIDGTTPEIEKNYWERIKKEDFNDVLNCISDEINISDDISKFQNTGKVLGVLNNYENNKDNVKIGNVIGIETPFSKEGILGNSSNKFVIFDTPGSNSASNKDHADVLKMALDGFSNGIPVWVTQPDTIDSVDNATLCDLIQEIEALDKRFTLIIVNKADQADLPIGGFKKEDIKRIREYSSIEKMYAGGIFYVSSAIALGSKNNGLFISNFLKKIYKNNKNMFIDKEDEDYQELYIYDILPKQMKDQICNVSSNSNNIIYANSGLLSVEEEMDIFATKHSSYNKCQMVEILFNDVIAKSNKRIEDKINSKNEWKEKEKNSLDEKKKNLIDNMENEAEKQKQIIKKESLSHVKIYLKENEYTKPKFEEVNNIDKERSLEEKEKKGYSEELKKLENIKKDKWQNFKENISSVINEKKPAETKKVFTQFLSNIKDEIEQNRIIDEKKNEINDVVSDDIIKQVKDLYINTIEYEISEIEQDESDFWERKSDNLKIDIYKIVSENEDLSNDEKEEIKKIIDNYEGIKRDEDISDLFLKVKFQRFLDKHKIDNKKLIKQYVKNMEANIKDTAYEINKLYIGLFDDWVEVLLRLITENITKYNKEIEELQNHINSLSEEIAKLRNDQGTIKTANENIKMLISWKEN